MPFRLPLLRESFSRCEREEVGCLPVRVVCFLMLVPARSCEDTNTKSPTAQLHASKGITPLPSPKHDGNCRIERRRRSWLGFTLYRLKAPVDSLDGLRTNRLFLSLHDVYTPHLNPLERPVREQRYVSLALETRQIGVGEGENA